MTNHPPKTAQGLLLRFLRNDLAEEVQGDLDEKFYRTAKEKTSFQAKLNYWYQVMNYLRPFAIKNTKLTPTPIIMFNHYIKISWRTLLRNKGYSFINIGGLAVGMAITLLIGLWVYDELSYDKYHTHHKDIAQIWGFQTFNNTIESGNSVARPMEFVLREEYGDYFKYIVMSSWNQDHILSYGETSISQRGNFMQEDIGKMLSLRMNAGAIDQLDKPAYIMLSAAVSKALFGSEDAIGKVVKLDNSYELSVAGVYEDLPSNSSFNNLGFIAPWSLYITMSDWLKASETMWDYSFQAYVQINENTDMHTVSEAIKSIAADRNSHAAKTKSSLFLHPMRDWHLRTGWKNGIPSGGRIEYVWLFQIIGGFVLFLACINFINLSTARSEKRAKEVGVRKSIGSLRQQLTGQFLSESFMIVLLSFIIALGIVLLALPAYNQLTEKQITLPTNELYFWLASFAFIIGTSLLAGSYPALYLSSFNPVSILKGTFHVGRFASLPRKVLVVIQFTFSIALIIGTILIFRQIQYTKNRPVGYNREGLLQMSVNTDDLKKKYGVLRNAFLQSGVVLEMGGSHSPATGVWSNSSGIYWEGKPDDFQASFAIIRISPEYGKTVGWNILDGRDFSSERVSDTAKIILNNSAVRYMGLEDPVGKFIRGHDTPPIEIIGVVDDMIMESPYRPVKQAIYTLDHPYNFYLLRLNPAHNPHESVAVLEKEFKKIFPDTPFSVDFVDDNYARKFENEERIGKLAGVFTALAIFISCIGLFGLAAFVAERRTKEIGIRKVLGASVLNLWRMLTKDFVILVVISSIIAMPIAYYFMDNWMRRFDYRLDISIWVFVISGACTLIITMLTVSFQAIKAAMLNPVNSLRSE